jgi:DNA polymerase elongation subunit (family B)
MPDVALTNRSYNETIKRADQYCKSKEYENALDLYKKSLGLKPDMEYPAKQIGKLNNILDLKKKISDISASYSYNKAMQLALKTVLNATYGAFANKYFVLSNSKIANAITAMGRDLIRYMIVSTENYFYNIWHTDTKNQEILGSEYIAVGKTDGKYYFLNKEFKKIDRPYQFFNTGESGDILLSRQINMSRLRKVDDIGSVGDFEILYEYKIFDIKEIKPLDVKPKWVKGVDNDSMFYHGNNPISMYGDTDSYYFSYKPLMESCGYEGNELEFILHFDKVIMKKLHAQFLEVYAKRYGVTNKQDFELETISKSILFFEKKNYLKNIVWEDGIFFEPLEYFSPTGIKIVRSETPPFVRGKDQKGGIWEFIRYLFQNSDNLNIKDILRIVKQIRKEFDLEEIDNISSQTGCSNYRDKVINDTTDIEIEKGAHYAVKAAAFYNYLLNRNSEYKTKYDMVRGGTRIKYYYCKHDKHNVFGYLRGMHPTEITEKERVIFDYDAQFDKTVLSICNSFLKALDLPMINKRMGVLGSLFAFKLQQPKREEEVEDEGPVVGMLFNVDDDEHEDDDDDYFK